MTDETIEACPRCDSAKIQLNAVGGMNTKRTPTKGRYRCNGCGHYFEAPAEREPEGHRNTGGPMRLKLLNANPEDWP